MKRLTIIRHAKSSWGDPGLDDHDRVLNARGLRVAPLMGELLAGKIDRPDVILSSTAKRARSTAGLVAAAFGFPDEQIIDEGQIYLASPNRLFQVLRQVDEEHGSAMIFGHVPGVQLLSEALAGGEGIGHFPTCGAAIFDLEIDHWGAIDPGCGKLIEFLCPKEVLPPESRP